MFITADLPDAPMQSAWFVTIEFSLSALQPVLAIWANVLNFYELVSKSYHYMFVTC